MRVSLRGDGEEGDSHLTTNACGDLWMQNRGRDFLAFYANPRMRSKEGHSLDHLVSIGAEMRSVMGAISPFQLQVVPGTTLQVFEQALREHRPRVISLTMHGVKNTGAMAFENDAGNLDLVPPQKICDAIERAVGKDGESDQKLSLLIVSTCNGSKLAKEVLLRRPSMAVAFWDSVVEDALSKDFSVAMHACVSREMHPRVFQHPNAISRQDLALRKTRERYGDASQSNANASLPRDDPRLRAFARAMHFFSRMTYCDPQLTHKLHRKSAHPCMGKAVIMFSDGTYRFARGEPSLLREYTSNDTDDPFKEIGDLAASMGNLDLNLAGNSTLVATVAAA